MESIISKTQSVPNFFTIPDRLLYPSNNFPDFELYFSQSIKEEDIPDGWTYLPILWTAYIKRHQYGKDKTAIKTLQNYIDSLDKTKRYFTIVQNDDGTFMDWKELDIRVYSMSGGPEMSYPLPLIGQPYPKKQKYESDKKYFANFIGRITHPIRKRMIDAVMNKSGYYVSTNDHNVSAYTRFLSQSIFTLAPSGYGPTSFRISEAIRQGSIPVYISDRFIIPHHIPFDVYGVIIKEKDIDNIDRILKDIPESVIIAKQSMLKEIFETFYSFDGNRKLILQNLKSLCDVD